MKSLTSTMLNKIKSFFRYIWTNKKKPRVFVTAIIVVIVLLFMAGGGGKVEGYALHTVATGEFIQEVSVTGKVTPAQKVDMGFEVGGRLASVNAVVGARVKKGQVLAKLSNAEYQATVSKSQAAYLSEQARLQELQRGSRPQEIAIADADVAVASQNVDQSKLSVVEQIKSSYAEADDALKNKADQVFNNPRSTRPELKFFVDGNPKLKESVEYQRLRLTEQFPDWQKLVASVSAGNLNDEKVAQARNYVSAVQAFLNDLNTAVNSMGSDTERLPENVQYRTDISAARGSVNSALQALNSSVNTLKTNQSALLRAEEQSRLVKSGSTAEEIAAQRAQAQSAAAGVSSASASLSKTVIVAPFDGVITRVEFKTGESVNSADPVVTIMSDAAFEIETYVSENDVPKLKINQPAKITLDALGDAVAFDAVVSQVDLSETIKDGVVTYKTRFQFISKDEQIKSGLTANITVETDRRFDTIKVPQSAIVLSKGKKHAKVAPADAVVWNADIDSKATLVPVTTGGIDREGDIEITSGLTAGQKIIVRAEAAE